MLHIKKALRYLDKQFFDSYLVEKRGYFLLRKQRNKFYNTFTRSLKIKYESKDNILAELCDKYGTDKGSNREYNSTDAWPSHTYTDYYYMIFNKNREKYRNVFECGIGTNNSDVKGYFKLDGVPGASLKVWRDYFPNAMIYGADIDPTCLVQENRIFSQVMDQTNPKSIHNYFDSIVCPSFDLMIDDGLHEFSAGKILFENSSTYLKPGGIYVIEDVVLEDLQSYRDFFSGSKHLVHFISMQREQSGLRSIAHNSLVVIEKKD
jgi:hypothetical protein